MIVFNNNNIKSWRLFKKNSWKNNMPRFRLYIKILCNSIIIWFFDYNITFKKCFKI